MAWGHRRDRRPGCGARGWRKNGNWTHAQPHFRYKTHPADLFSPHARYKIRPARPKWPFLARFSHAGRTLYRFRQQATVQGELCTVFVSKQPCRANFVPLSPGRSHAWRTLYRMRGRDGASHHSTPGTAGVEGAGGTGGHKRVRLRCPWAVAGPGRAAHRHPDRLEAAAWPAGLGRASRRRAERSSQRGRRAGGQAARRPEICRGNKQQSAAGVEGAGGRALRRPEHPWGHEQPCQTGHTNHNLRNWAASRPTARSTRNAILKSPGHLQCRRRNAPQVRR